MHISIGFFSVLIVPFWELVGVIEHITIAQLVSRCIKVLLLRNGILTGAMWFVPLYLITATLFHFIMHFVKYRKSAAIGLIIFGFIGNVFVFMQKLNFYYINIALLMQSVCLLGYVLNNCSGFPHFKRPLPVCMVSAVTIILLNNITGLEIELSKHKVYGTFGFYPMTVIGLIFVISLEKLIYDSWLSKKLQNLMAFIGKNSFIIMAFHLMIFKLLDVVFSYSIQECMMDSQNNLLKYLPYSFPKLRIVYFMLGCSVPLFVKEITTKLRYKLKKGHVIDFGQ